MVRKNLDKQGLTSVILLEGNLVLLRFSNESDPATLLDKGRDILEQHFHWVERWSPNIFKKRCAYIRVMGVPLDAWGERFFTMIGDQCGRFVSMDDSTMKKSRLDFGRVLINTYSAEIISKCLTVRIDSKECKIRVIEEAFQNSDCTVGDGSSDEVEPQSDGNGSLCKGDNMEMLKKKIFTGNIECSNVQNGPQECSLCSKQHNYLQEGDEVVGSSDQGLQEEITGSEPPKNHPGELGSQE
ncbi:hypothetical protein SLEP1_g38546 [Rubroshorea leprosula]|nr:hypothetical protein SLEP1_g38546 [Rubroshorea leprosula]